MKEESTQEHKKIQGSAMAPQVIYGYQPDLNRDDEIDIGAIFFGLLKKSKLMAGIVIAGTVLSVIVALLLPKIFEQEVIVSRPQLADISAINNNSFTETTPQKIFNRLYNDVRSPENLKHYANSYLARLYPESKKDKKMLFAQFIKNFSVTIIEPKPEAKGGSVIDPNRLSITLMHAEEAVAVELLNSYVEYTSSQLMKKIKSEQKAVISDEIQVNTRQIRLLRNKAKLDRDAEIFRLEEEINEKIISIKEKVEALKTGADIDKNNMIEMLTEAKIVAKKLGIKNPTYLSALSKNNNKSQSATEITLSESQELPLYLMGTVYIEAKILELKQRENDLPFIKEYSKLQQDLSMLKNNAQLKSLKSRTSDDAYIEKLTEKLNLNEKLKAYTLNFDAVKTHSLEKSAEQTGLFVKPNKKLIVILGVVLSGIIALVAAMIALAISNRKAEA